MEKQKSDNFETRIIQESKEKREKRIRDSIVEAGLSASEQLKTYQIYPRIPYLEEFKIKNLEQDYSENGKLCLKIFYILIWVSFMCLVIGNFLNENY